LGAIPKIGTQEGGQVTNRQNNMVNTGTLHLAQQYLQDWEIADGHERFG
jgi:hypothetical protein